MATKRNSPVEKQVPIEQEEKPMRFRIEQVIHHFKHQSLHRKANQAEKFKDHSDNPGPTN